jgi:hypothetical protein
LLLQKGREKSTENFHLFSFSAGLLWSGAQHNDYDDDVDKHDTELLSCGWVWGTQRVEYDRSRLLVVELFFVSVRAVGWQWM